MRLIPHLLALFILFPFVSVLAQSRPITAEEYNAVFESAGIQTNAAFPFIFTVTTDFIENGKIVSTVTEIDERESQVRERITTTTVTRGKTMRKYQVTVDTGKVYCSDDGVSWKPPSPYECSGPVSFYGRRTPESVEYSAEQKSLNGKKVKVYREYSVFASSTPNGKKEFRDEISTIDSRGFLINIVTTEGTLDPRTVTLIRKQSWDANTKIKSIVAPIK